MKSLFITLFCLFSITANAQPQESDDVLTAPAVDGVRYFPKKSEKASSPELAMFYLRFGKSVGSDGSNQNQNNVAGSFGIRKYVDTFTYGMEYTYHYMQNGIRFYDIDFTLGYRPDWNYSVNPYALVGSGLSFSSDSEHQGRSGGNGLNYFVDLGMEFWRIKSEGFNMKFMTGMKYTHETLTGGPSPTMNFNDFYISIGFGW